MEKSSGQGALENFMVQIRLKDFDAENNSAVKVLKNKFGEVPNQNQLYSLAKVLGEKLDIPVDREASRRKKVLIKWFDENIEKIQPFLEKNIKVNSVNIEENA